MVRRWLVGVGLVLVATTVWAAEESAAPTIEEIVSRHVAAKGGLEAIHAASALRLRGEYTAFGEAAPFELVQARPQLYRFDHRAMDADITYAYDGEKAWWINIAMGYEWAVAPPLPERRFLYSESLFDDPLIDAQGRGITLAAGGPGEMDGSPTVTVVATLPDGSEETWHLDPTTWLEVKRESRGADFGREVPCITYYTDFRPVAGVLYPFRIEQEYSIRWRVFEVASIEVNPAIDATVFDLPIEPELAKFAGIAGRWEVTYESVAYPGAPPFEAKGASSIAERFDGRLFVEDSNVVTASAAFLETRTWSWDRFRKNWTLVSHDDLGANATVLHGTEQEDGSLVFDTLATGTTVVIGDDTYHSRFTVRRSDEGGMIVVFEASTDAGETWTPGYTATYRRSED